MARKEYKGINFVDNSGPAGGMWFMGFIGSAIYFVSQAEGFWYIVWAILKALVWPAYLVNRAFTLLQIT